MMTDPISDMLSRIRNASLVHKASVELPSSKLKLGIAKLLEAEGFIAGVEEREDGNKRLLRFKLKYGEDRTPAITGIRRISKPGQRLYVKADDLKVIRSGFGLAIVSTPNGLMTNTEAHKRRLGGEILCEIY
jgi:small subunit ribosomal protein S8